MIGLDTNVLVAWFLQGQARSLPRSGPYRISLVVLAELIWVFRRRMNRPKTEVVALVEALVKASDVRFEDTDVVTAALHDYRNGRADFADYLLMRDNEAGGCSATLTFDRQAGRSKGFVHIGKGG